ncbi:unnamed protein product, partial [Allacma fusca]
KRSANNSSILGMSRKVKTPKRPTTFRTIPIALEIKKEADVDTRVAPRIFLDKRWIIYMGGESGNQSDKGFLNLRHWNDKSASAIGDGIAIPEEHIPVSANLRPATSSSKLGKDLQAKLRYFNRGSLFCLDQQQRLGADNAVSYSKNNTNLPKIFAPGIHNAISTTSSRGHHVTENVSASNSARRTTTGDEGADFSKIINNSNSIVHALNDAEEGYRLLKRFYRDVPFQGQNRTFVYVKRLGRTVNFDIRRSLWLIKRLVSYYMQNKLNAEELLKCLYRCSDICLQKDQTGIAGVDNDVEVDKAINFLQYMIT